MASPLLLMIGPGSRGGGIGCGSTESRTPPFQIRRREATTTPIVMRRPIDDSTRAANLPCWRQARPAGRRGCRWIEEGGRESGTPAGLASAGIIATRRRRDTLYTHLLRPCYRPN